MSQHSVHENQPLRDGQTVQVQRIGTFRRLAPQVSSKNERDELQFQHKPS